MAKLTAKVSIEKVIHSALQTTLQNIWDKYGIRVDEITAEWIDVSRIAKPAMLLKSINVRMHTECVGPNDTEKDNEE